MALTDFGKIEGGRMLNCTRYADINEFTSVETKKPTQTVKPEESEETENLEETETPAKSEKPKQTEIPSTSAKPTMSASPMVSVTSRISATPGMSSSRPEATKGPMLGETGPKPTVSNLVAEATATPNPTQENAVKVGDIFLYKNVKYKVTEYHGKTVANVSLIGYNKSASSLTLADQVKYKDKYIRLQDRNLDIPIRRPLK